MRSLKKMFNDYRQMRLAEIELNRYTDSELRDLGIARGSIRSLIRNGRGDDFPADGVRR